MTMLSYHITVNFFTLFQEKAFEQFLAFSFKLTFPNYKENNERNKYCL